MKTKTIYLIIAFLFLAFAIVQYNDPDPLLWMLIYGAVSLVATLKIYLRQVNYRPLVATLIVLFFVYALTFIPGFITFLQEPDKSELFGKMEVTKSWIESTRELFGLILAIAALFYLRNSQIQKKKSSATR